MSKRPAILALHFFLELAALVVFFYWGWYHHSGVMQYALGFGLPLIAGGLWMTLRVPGDPGDAIVPIPGPARLLLELALLGLAVLLLVIVEETTSAIILGVLVLIDYAFAYERVWGLLTGTWGTSPEETP